MTFGISLTGFVCRGFIKDLGFSLHDTRKCTPTWQNLVPCQRMFTLSVHVFLWAQWRFANFGTWGECFWALHKLTV